MRFGVEMILALIDDRRKEEFSIVRYLLLNRFPTVRRYIETLRRHSNRLCQVAAIRPHFPFLILTRQVDDEERRWRISETRPRVIVFASFTRHSALRILRRSLTFLTLLYELLARALPSSLRPSSSFPSSSLISSTFVAHFFHVCRSLRVRPSFHVLPHSTSSLLFAAKTFVSKHG